LPTFFAAAKKVGAAPHRGNANRPTRQQGEANQPRTTKKAPPCTGATLINRQASKERPTPHDKEKAPTPRHALTLTL
ncbi:hypothetical protein F6X39_34490, partial [Paraburkholderia sp. UCT2]|nr:hypothetical protein [Paraburkholderia sp. UCT2]